MLRAHGVCETAIQTIFRSVIIAKLTYAGSSAAASNCQRIDALLRRCKRHCYYATHLMTMFDELCDAADEQLFDDIADKRFLHCLL